MENDNQYQSRYVAKKGDDKKALPFIIIGIIIVCIVVFVGVSYLPNSNSNSNQEGFSTENKVTPNAIVNKDKKADSIRETKKEETQPLATAEIKVPSLSVSPEEVKPKEEKKEEKPKIEPNKEEMKPKDIEPIVSPQPLIPDGEGELHNVKWANTGLTYNYKGQIKKGRPHGFGTAIYSDGDKYVGSFVNGLRQGRGTVYFSDGIVAEGSFKGDVYHGDITFRQGHGEETKRYVNGREVESSDLE